MTCPVCRQRTVLGMRGAAGLKPNFVFSNMIEMLETWKKSRISVSPTRSVDSIGNCSVMCDTCPANESVMATFQCLECLDLLCADCAAFHSRTKLTRSHKVVPLQEIENGIHEKIIRSRELSRCPLHENIRMEHYCEKCDVPVCRDCILDTHQTHRHIALEEAERKQKDNVKKMKSQLEAEITKMSESLKEIEIKEKRENERMEKVNAEITSRSEHLIQIIKKKEALLLEKSVKANQENCDRISAFRGELNTQLNCMENCVQLSECVLEDGAAVEIITMHRQMVETVKQLQCRFKEVETSNKTTMESITSFKFEADSVDPNLGELTVEGNCEKSNGKPEFEEDQNNEHEGCDDKNPFLMQPAASPIPSPRRRSQNEDKIKQEAKKRVSIPQAVKRTNVESKNAYIPKALNRKSVLLRATSMHDLLGQQRPHSDPNMSGLKARGSFGKDIKRKAPKPPENSNRKKEAPSRVQIPPPPPSPSKKPPHPKQHVKPSQPIRAERLVKFGKRGKVITNGEFTAPPKCAIFSGSKKKILVLDSENKHILIFTAQGWFKKSFNITIPADKAQLKPVSFTETENHQVLVLYKNFITSWSWDGTMEHLWGSLDLKDANSVTVDTRGRILVSDQTRHMVFVYDPETRQKILQFGGFGDRDDLLKSPRYICTDRQDNIIVSDHHNHCIKIFNCHGEFLFKFGERGVEDGQLRYPESVTCLKMESDEDGILVADEGNCRVSLFSSRGVFVGHVLTKKEDPSLTGPQFLSVSLNGRGEEMAVRQTSQTQIRVYRLYQFVDRTR